MATHQLDRSPLRTRIQHVLLERILDGDMEPGEQVNLSHLSDDLGVSRTPLREALLALEQDEFVEYTPGKGFRLVRLSAREAVNLYQIAGALETLALRTTERLSDEMIRDLEEANRRLAGVQGQPTEMIKWDGRFHTSMISSSTNEDLITLIGRIRDRLYRYRLYGYEYVVSEGSPAKKKSVDEHAEIIDLLDGRELDRAAEALDDHWGRGTAHVERWLKYPQESPEAVEVQERADEAT